MTLLINSKPLWKHAFTNISQNRVFIIRFLCFYKKKKSFYEARTKSQMPDDTYRKNCYINVVIL